MKWLSAGILCVLTTTAMAEDPCTVLGFAGYSEQGQPYFLCTDGGGNQVRIYDSRLLARLIEKQSNLHNEMVELRKELKSSTDNLAKAVESLATVSRELNANNRKWHDETVKQAIVAINSMPERLAEEVSLQVVLSAAVKDRLLKDDEFLGAVNRAFVGEGKPSKAP